MTQLAHDRHFCYQCRSRAVFTCDFQRTAYDRCGRPTCAEHGVDVVTGHLCEHHQGTIDKVTSSDKNRKGTGATMKAGSFAGVIGILVAAAIVFSMIGESVKTAQAKAQSFSAALLR